MTPPSPPTALVLGAGLQGVATALALSREGWHVELIDRGAAPMLRTSMRGEGKIHLGYVYGKEPSRATAQLMIDGALSFGELLDSWLPRPIDWPAMRSERFTYAILADSMVSPERLAEHYRWVDDTVADRISDGAGYVGADTFSPSKQLASPRQAGYSADVVVAHQTSEVAIDPDALRRLLITGLQAHGITCTSHHLVRSVERTPHGFVVTTTQPDGVRVTLAADAVVNCLWEGRLVIDATMGIAPTRPCLYRLKYAVNASMNPHAARGLTTTFTLGPYGDVVSRGDGRVYLSWYPTCMTEMSMDLEIPASWQPVLESSATTPTARGIAVKTVAQLSKRVGALRNVRIDQVNAGVVVAWGESDIDQPSSDLHRRHDIGVHDHDGYVSVDTGKLTTAPMFASEVANVLGSRKGWG